MKHSLLIVRCSGSVSYCMLPAELRPFACSSCLTGRSKTTTVISNDDPYSTIAHLHLDECTLADKPDYPHNETWEEKRLRIKALVGVPLLFDELADEVQEDIKRVYGTDSLPSELQALINLRLSRPLVQRSDASITRRGDWLALSEVTAYKAGVEDEALTLEEEVTRCFSNLEGK